MGHGKCVATLFHGALKEDWSEGVGADVDAENDEPEKAG